ncbi:hypothetical protein [Chitinophaga sp. LS1]|uniref:hypothetical protein n=1 Tax=Chitinophaga sp. LS1 TaxID=3051176 RepID=UPI002AAB8603|nr:hypothetical protein [Chitinophaga sp. LS1]WPV68173.1 hypothetical protein QQL36_05510 [Chitinophaga sp. LS1]
MKKIILSGVLASVVAFYACTKEGTTTTITNTVHDTTIVTTYASGIANADTLTAGLKVAYGSSVTGTFPAASADASAPVLDSLYNKTYTVIKSRYLIIYPPNVSGNVAGYYVQIAGAASYFKIDYTQAYGLRKAAKQARAAATKTPNARGIGDGYIDSTIVFKLPATINGDTFYVKYAAYDTLGRVSDAITATVLVLPEGSDKWTDSLTGTWNYYGHNYYYNGSWEYTDYQVDTLYNYNQNFDCNNDQLSFGSTLTIPYYKNIYHSSYSFDNYSFTYSYSNNYGYLDMNTSTCSNYVYNLNYSADSEEGGFSYDPATKKFTVIYDGSSNVDISYDSYHLAELTDKYMILSYKESDNDYNGTIDYYKYIKQ